MSRELLRRGLNYWQSPGIKPIHEYEALRDAIETELAKPDEAIGEIKMIGINGVLGAPFHGVVWRNGIIPDVGTKIYINPPRQQEPLSVVLLGDFKNWREHE